MEMIKVNRARYFSIVVACGHVGHGNSIEVTRYFEAEDILSAMDSARFMPRSKKKASCIKRISPITYDEYLAGKLEEAENPYLNWN